MNISINHTVPESPYFLIAYPKREYPLPRGCKGETIIELKDIKLKTSTFAGFFGHTEIPIKDLEKHDLLSFVAYGISAVKLKEALILKYPELTKLDAVVEFWILKKFTK